MKQQTEFGEIPLEWEVKQVIEIKDEAKRAIAMGPFGSNIKAENFVESGVPVIRGTNMNFAKFVDGEFVFLTEKKADELLGSNCHPDDLVFTHRGTIGQVALIPKNKYPRYVISQSGMKLTVNQEVMDSEFLFYFFKSEYGQYQILKYEAQVGVPSISNPLTSLKQMCVPVPPLPEQKAIASVLSSLDDKIDLLHRQNKTLEAMAETLFRQWFIEEAKEDWIKGKVEDLFTLQRGYDLPSSKRIKGEFPLYAASGLNDMINAYQVEYPTVITGRSGSIGGVYISLEKSWPLNTTLFIKEFKLGTLVFSYFYLKYLDLESFNAGSAVPSLNRNHVHGLEIQLPPSQLIKEYEEIAQDWMLKVKANKHQIQTLENLRDTLLPKLMSGEVRVQYQTEEVA